MPTDASNPERQLRYSENFMTWVGENHHADLEKLSQRFADLDYTFYGGLVVMRNNRATLVLEKSTTIDLGISPDGAVTILETFISGLEKGY